MTSTLPSLLAKIWRTRHPIAANGARAGPKKRARPRIRVDVRQPPRADVVANVAAGAVDLRLEGAVRGPSIAGEGEGLAALGLEADAAAFGRARDRRPVDVQVRVWRPDVLGAVARDVVVYCRVAD